MYICIYNHWWEPVMGGVWPSAETDSPYAGRYWTTAGPGSLHSDTTVLLSSLPSRPLSATGPAALGARLPWLLLFWREGCWRRRKGRGIHAEAVHVFVGDVGTILSGQNIHWLSLALARILLQVWQTYFGYVVFRALGVCLWVSEWVSVCICVCLCMCACVCVCVCVCEWVYVFAFLCEEDIRGHLILRCYRQGKATLFI